MTSLPMDGEWLAYVTIDVDGQKIKEEKPFTIAVQTKENAHKFRSGIVKKQAVEKS